MRSSQVLFGSLVAVLASGCFSLVKLDGYKEDVPPASMESSTSTTGEVAHLNLRFVLIGLKPHVGQKVEYRVVDGHNFIQSRGVINAMPNADVTLNAPLAVPKQNGPYHLDFYADVNKSGGYDGLGSVITNDHAWRIDPLADYPEGLTPIAGTVQVRFTHNTSFTDINQYPSGTPNLPKDTTLPANLHMQGLEAIQGKLAEVRVSDRVSHHVVALYRITEVRGAALDATVPGCVESGADYDVDVYVDANSNGAYDDPSKAGGDLGFRVGGTASDTGLQAQLDVAVSMSSGNIAVGAP